MEEKKEEGCWQVVLAVEKTEWRVENGDVMRGDQLRGRKLWPAACTHPLGNVISSGGLLCDTALIIKGQRTGITACSLSSCRGSGNRFLARC